VSAQRSARSGMQRQRVSQRGSSTGRKRRAARGQAVRAGWQCGANAVKGACRVRGRGSSACAGVQHAQAVQREALPARNAAAAQRTPRRVVSTLFDNVAGYVFRHDSAYASCYCL